MYTYEIQQELDIYDEDVKLRTLSKHLRIMEHAGLVHSTTSWTHKKYSLDRNRIKQFVEYFRKEVEPSEIKGEVGMLEFPGIAV